MLKENVIRDKERYINACKLQTIYTDTDTNLSHDTVVFVDVSGKRKDEG